MTRLWLVRHGPTHAKGMIGWTDLPADLSDGPALARLSAALPAAPVVSSDLRRTIDTATALQADRPRLPHEHALREFHFGDWEGRGFDGPEDPELRAYFDDPGTRRAPGGESWEDVAARAGAALARVATGPDLIVVTHMGVILTQWARATGQAPYSALAQRIDPLSLTRIDLGPDAAQPVAVNRLP